MKFITKQEGFALKAKRQLELKQYSKKFEIHCGGACAHYGKIPKGCAGCLFNDVFAHGIFLGCGLGLKNVCNADCKHCFTKKGTGKFDRNFQSQFCLPDGWESIIENKLSDTSELGKYKLFADSIDHQNSLAVFSFGGEGSEPLFYIDAIEKVMKYYIDEVEPIIGKNPIYKLYTNGKLLTSEMVDRLANAGITELRVNPSAFGFSDEIFKNVQNACAVIPVVTNEVAVFPEYYDNLIKLLPILEEIGVDHLSLCQPKYKDMDVLKENLKYFPEDAVCYPASNDWIVVDDGGISEELIKIAIDNDYSFSIMDCNCMLLSQEKQTEGIGKDINTLHFSEVISS